MNSSPVIRVILSVVLATLTSLASVATFAAPITFTYTASGSGSIGGIGFTDANYVITGTGDTDNRITLIPDVFTQYSITHSTATIAIDGVETAFITQPTRTVYDTSSIPIAYKGVSLEAEYASFFLLFSLGGEEFPQWDMLSSITMSGLGGIRWATAGVTTDMGLLFIDDMFNVPATFQAAVVPIPPAVWLFGSGLIGLVAMARRRTQS